MEPLTFDAFTKKIYIKSSLEKLYACWSTKDGIESWFLRKAEYTDANGRLRAEAETIATGDTYVWQWHNWDGKESGTILKANGKDFLEFSFASDICKVSVSLEQKDRQCLLL